MLMASWTDRRGDAVSSIQLAMDLAAPDHPGRLVGAMLAQVAIVGGLVWLVVWAVRARGRRQAQHLYPPGYYLQYPSPQAPSTHHPAAGGSYPPQAPLPTGTR